MIFANRAPRIRAASRNRAHERKGHNRARITPAIEVLERRALLATLVFSGGSQLSATLQMDMPPAWSSTPLSEQQLDDSASITDLNSEGNATGETAIIPVYSNYGASFIANYSLAVSRSYQGTQSILTFDESGTSVTELSDAPFDDVSGTGGSPITVTVQPGPDDHVGDPVTVVLTADLSISTGGVTVPDPDPSTEAPGENGFYSEATNITTAHVVTYVSGDQQGTLLDTSYSSQGDLGTFPTHQQVSINTKVGQSFQISVDNDTTGSLMCPDTAAVNGVNFSQTLAITLALTSNLPDPKALSSIVDLGPMQATAINDSGQVVGTSSNGAAPSTGVLYTGGATVSLQGIAAPNAINDSGQVAGISDADHAAVWTPDKSGTGGTVTDLGTLGGAESIAWGINDSGQVVGQSDVAGGSFPHAFLYTPNQGGTGGTMTDLGSLSPLDQQFDGSSIAYGINDSGQVVGDGVSGFLYTPNKVGASGTITSVAGGVDAINSSGQVVGNDSPSVDAFLFTPNQSGTGWTTTDLGTLPGDDASYATGISDSGEVVGWCSTPNGGDGGYEQQAFLYTKATGMVNLNSLLPDNSGWNLISATAINNSGQVIGQGVNSSGETDAFLLTLKQPGSGNQTGWTAQVLGDRVVPSQATDLNLYQLFGGEAVNVPVTVSNQGTSSATGNVQVELYLSTTMGSPPGNPIATMTQPVQDLASTDNPVEFDFNGVSIPTNLTTGAAYYLVAKVSVPNAQGTGGPAQTYVAASPQTFEYLRTPTYTQLFTGPSPTYFNFIRDTLNAADRNSPWAVQQQDPNVTNLNDGMAFIAAFEGDKRYPYLDSNKIPTIGVGINLTTIDKPLPKSSPYVSLQHDLAADVINYYSAMKDFPSYRFEYKKIRSDTGANSYKLVQMLEQQARAGTTQIALTPDDDDSLFAVAYLIHEQQAQKVLGATWLKLQGQRALITPIDQVYNNKGGDFPKMAKALAINDLILAGFDAVDSQNVDDAVTDPGNYGGLKLRMEAEYQNLVANSLDTLDKLGEIIS